MELSLETIFGMVIGVIFVIIIGFVIVNLIKLYLPQEIDEATMSSFEEIVNTINSLDGQKDIIINIKESFMIVGFGSNQHIIDNTVSRTGIYVESLFKPCKSDKACLCVCAYESRGLAYKLEKKDCFKYKNKCAEFDNINSLSGNTQFGEYFILSPVLGYKSQTISGDKWYVGENKPYKISIKVQGDSASASLADDIYIE